jgi:capsular polysaccharide transport system permease protein
MSESEIDRVLEIAAKLSSLRPQAQRFGSVSGGAGQDASNPVARPANRDAQAQSDKPDDVAQESLRKNVTLLSQSGASPRRTNIVESSGGDAWPGAKGRIAREETLRAALPAANRPEVNVAAAAGAKPAGASQRQRPDRTAEREEGADGPSPGGGSVLTRSGQPGERGNTRKAMQSSLPTLRTAERPNWKRESTVPNGAEKLAVPQAELAPLPQLKVKRSFATSISFLVCVALPVIAASIYYGFIASPQYVAEFRFSVTQSSPPALASSGVPTVGNGPSPISNGQIANTTAIAAAGSPLPGGFSVTAGSQQNQIVVDYLLSRQAVADLQERIGVERLYAKPEVDWWARFDDGKPREKFVDYWRWMVSANYDMITGLATAQVRAFAPEDAQLIADSLVKLSDELVNRIDMRPKQDFLKFAQEEYRRAEASLKTAHEALTNLRDTETIVDPDTSAVAGNVQLAATLKASLTQLQAKLNSLIERRLDLNGPNAQMLRSQIDAARDQLAQVEGEVSHTSDGAVLANIIGGWEQLILDWQYAQTSLLMSKQNLDQARALTGARTLYLTPYVMPAKPESPTYPLGTLWTFLFGLTLFGTWLAGLLIVKTIKEINRT